MTVEVWNGDSGGAVSVCQPLLEEGLQFTHVVKAQIEGLESGDGRLAEVVPIHPAHGEADVSLGVSQLDPLLFELPGKVLQLLQRNVIISRRLHGHVEVAAVGLNLRLGGRGGQFDGGDRGGDGDGEWRRGV